MDNLFTVEQIDRDTFAVSDGDTVHIDFSVRQQFAKLFVDGNLAEQPVIDTPAF